MKNERPFVGLLGFNLLVVGLIFWFGNIPECYQSVPDNSYTSYLKVGEAILFTLFIVCSLIATLLMIFNGKTFFFSKTGTVFFVLFILLPLLARKFGKVVETTCEYTAVHYVVSALFVLVIIAVLLDIIWLAPRKK